MKISVTMPFDSMANAEEFHKPEAVREVAQAAERAGFDGVSVTDHPCPTGRWLDAGGHVAQDPFVLLSLVAAATSKIRLQTGILVLPYRNPFITARSVATLDVFSNGRVSLGIGAGYLKGEYKALGVEFDRRNDIMDEYMKALKAAWGDEEFTFEGTGYQALGNRILPMPVQKPHPPLMVGGNSKRAIRRAVELGDAWYPFFAPALLASTARTTPMGGEEDLAEGIKYMNVHCEKVGRKEPPKVVGGSLNYPGEEWNPEAILEAAGRMSDLGVVSGIATVSGRTCAEWCDNAARYGEDVLAKIS